MDITGWLQRAIYTVAAGGTIVLPPGTWTIGFIKISAGMTGITIQGHPLGTTLQVRGTEVGIYVDGADNITIEDVTINATRGNPSLGAVHFRSCATITVQRCTIIGGQTGALTVNATNGATIDTVTVGGMSDLGAGKGRGIHLILGTLNATVDTVRAYDANLRHLVCLEDNVESTVLTDIQTEQAHDFASVDLHGKLEGNASTGSVTINNSAGRLNIGNPDHTNGSHATVTNHDGQGKVIGVQVNSVLRYQNVANATIEDQSGGTATITNMGGAG